MTFISTQTLLNTPQAGLSKIERRARDAAQIVADGAGRFSPILATEIQRFLPFRRLDDSTRAALYQRRFGETLVRLESGIYEDGTLVGLPYGSRARLILLYLQNEYFHSGALRISFRPSLYGWVKDLGINQVGGMTYKQVVDQAIRLHTCKLRIERESTVICDGHFTELVSWPEPEPSSHAAGMPFPQPAPSSSGNAMIETAVLQQSFITLLTGQPIELDPLAVGQLVDNSLALDFYVWLRGVLPGLNTEMPTGWDMLESHFALEYRRGSNMKQAIREAAMLAVSVYPGAQLITGEQGLLLLPLAASPTP